MCLAPWYREDILHGYKSIPCSNCPVCKKRRANAWAFRLMQEEKRSISASFLTFTYAPEHLTGTDNGLLNLSKEDMQNFMKRLRIAHGNMTTPIKYYVCGEYGGETDRPHYHMLLYNADIRKIQPAWDRGDIYYGDASGASTAYTLKYISKPGRIPMFEGDDRQPEFSLMSKGLGSGYLTPQMVAWHKDNLENRLYLNLLDGKKIAMPRYYKDKIYNDQERKKISAAAQQRIQDAEKKFLQHPEYDKLFYEMEASKLAAYKALEHSSLLKL